MLNCVPCFVLVRAYELAANAHLVVLPLPRKGVHKPTSTPRAALFFWSALTALGLAKAFDLSLVASAKNLSRARLAKFDRVYLAPT